MNPNEPPRNESEASIQERILLLASKLEQEVSKVNSSHHSDLQYLAAECNKAVKELTSSFDQRLRQLQKLHNENIANIEEEIAYLRELSASQHLMLRNNIEYIRELEERYVSGSGAQEG